MTIHAEDISCTLCGAGLPVPTTAVPGSPGALALDSTFVDEHVEMHTTCTCHWDGLLGLMARLDTDPTCPHHGYVERRYAAVSDGNLLGDILADEEDTD
jgi:hypothetical protein